VSREVKTIYVSLSYQVLFSHMQFDLYIFILSQFIHNFFLNLSNFILLQIKTKFNFYINSIQILLLNIFNKIKFI